MRKNFPIHWPICVESSITLSLAADTWPIAPWTTASLKCRANRGRLAYERNEGKNFAALAKIAKMRIARLAGGEAHAFGGADRLKYPAGRKQGGALSHPSFAQITSPISWPEKPPV